MLKCFPATTRASWNLYLCINNLSTSALGERNNFEGVNSQGMISFLRSFSSNLTFANLQIYFLIQKKITLEVVVRTQNSLKNNFAGVTLQGYSALYDT